MIAKSIDEVIQHLDSIIATSVQESSRLGFFAALYRQVTIKVKEGIASGRFEDGARMEQLDVIFANRYLEAYDQFRNSVTPTRSWLVAFEAARRWRLLILQHLLLGINAHINLDLGIAAAQTSPGEKLPALKRDFEEINQILAELLDDVQQKIGALSLLLGLLDHFGSRTDEAIFDFSLIIARDGAWRFAGKFAALTPEQQQAAISERDEKITALANKIISPGWLIRLLALVIRLFESSNVPKIIQVLS
jgi:uncharacterized protein YoaH (UPF0181 family)